MPRFDAHRPSPPQPGLLDHLNTMEAQRSHFYRQSRHTALARNPTAEARELQRDPYGRAHYETVMRMTLAIDLRDRFSGAHSLRTGKSAMRLAQALGCDEAFCARIELAAPAHDIGKIGVPDHVLTKPGRLNEHERRLVEAHCEMGALLLSSADSPELQLAAQIALTHHERWDGMGYPRRLKGAEIPLAGQIVAVVDVFDALASGRPYRQTLPLDVVLDYIEAERGHAFAPAVVDAFLPRVPQIMAEDRPIGSAPEPRR